MSVHGGSGAETAGRAVVGVLLFVLPLALSFAVYRPSTRKGGAKWLEKLNQSPLTPPSYVFSVVWTLLYLLMGAAAAVYVDGAIGPGLRSGSFGAVAFFILGLLAFVAQLAVNYAYLHVMFVKKEIWRGQRLLYALLILLALCILLFSATSPLGASLLLPYAAYLFYAWQLQSYLTGNNTPKDVERAVQDVEEGEEAEGAGEGERKRWTSREP